MTDKEVLADPQKMQSNKNITTIMYALYALTPLLGGLTALAAIIMYYLKRDEMAGTIFASHFRWQIRTFWYALLWVVLSLFFSFSFGLGFMLGGALPLLPFGLGFGFGYFLMIITLIWFIYRIAKGWLELSANRPMYASRQRRQG